MNPAGESGAAGRAINLSLVSHTNAGKTTLVRTLLRQDVGEVRDAAHVTEVATGYVMLQSGGDTLMLWDTPGFGDTARLLRRLKISRNPLAWFLTQVWDRVRERPLWSSQQAVKNAKEHADVVLYLVNASEDPHDAAYVGLEMEILAWVGKPVILLLNQMGPPNEGAAFEEERWRTHLSASPVLAGVLTMDAFARCWVQEGTLLSLIGSVLPLDLGPTMNQLTRAWRSKNLQRFRASMKVLAEHLALVATDREPITSKGWRDNLAGALGAQKNEGPESKRAMQQLNGRLETGIRASTEELIRLHGLSGAAAREVLKRLGKDYATSGPAKEGFAAILGGLTSGAIGGLAADIAAGGLTLGGGMLVGGVLGALGAGGLARGYNIVRGDAEPTLRWSEELFEGLISASLLRYMAVAHFGRGRGDYEEGEHPAIWRDEIARLIDHRRQDLQRIWRQGKAGEAELITAELEQLLGEVAAGLLTHFYPQAEAIFAKTPERPVIRDNA